MKERRREFASYKVASLLSLGTMRRVVNAIRPLGLLVQETCPPR